ncbi:MAG: hypothetical protein JJV98_04775 [Desulfosarcina sp.]|nr:hypothetical protein [Desulfobacterales bacterium]
MTTPLFTIEELLPHRDTMCLIDRIVQVNEKEAVTEARPRENWPLYRRNAVSSLLAVELGAQTAGILIGHKERQAKGGLARGRGWLVGIRQTRFHRSEFPLGTPVTTRARLGFSYDTYVEIEATAMSGVRTVAEMALQFFWDTEKMTDRMT